MRSDLFHNAEAESDPGTFTKQNSRMLKVRLSGTSGCFYALQGSMVAYQGDVHFAYEGSGGMGKFLKKAFTGEGMSLMKVSGSGDVFLARDADEIFLLHLENESVTINGKQRAGVRELADLGHQAGRGCLDVRRAACSTRPSPAPGSWRSPCTARPSCSTSTCPTFVDMQTRGLLVNHPALRRAQDRQGGRADRSWFRRGLPAGADGQRVRRRAGLGGSSPAGREPLTGQRSREGHEPPDVTVSIELFVPSVARMAVSPVTTRVPRDAHDPQPAIRPPHGPTPSRDRTSKAGPSRRWDCGRQAARRHGVGQAAAGWRRGPGVPGIRARHHVGQRRRRGGPAVGRAELGQARQRPPP